MKFKTQLRLLFWFLFVISLICIISCSSNCYETYAKLKRKCPELVKKDSITIHDTTVINGIKKDTVFENTTDTLIIKEKQLTMRYFYNQTTNTVFLSGKCDTVVVVKEIKTVRDFIITPGVAFDALTTYSFGFIKKNWWVILVAVAVVYAGILVRKKNETH